MKQKKCITCEGFLDLVYEKLVSLIVGSYYVSLRENKIVKSFSQDITETSKNIGT